jgi:hypothetical protein
MTKEEIEKEISDLEYDIAMEADMFLVGCMERRLAELKKLL